MNRLVTNDKSQVQVIARAATILRALEEENSGLSLGQIAQRVNLARSTVQRIVAGAGNGKSWSLRQRQTAACGSGRRSCGSRPRCAATSFAMARPFLERLRKNCTRPSTFDGEERTTLSSSTK
jgi:hypothetical protein